MRFHALPQENVGVSGKVMNFQIMNRDEMPTTTEFKGFNVSYTFSEPHENEKSL